MAPTSLDPAQRTRDLAGMARQPVDLLVIGGGVTGAGIALDAVSRGLRTAVVEARDWAEGTSSRSSKLVHGGLRYLQQLNFALVAEALKERDLLMHRIAPHLVHPVQFLYPLQHKGWERPYVATGIGIYDALAHVGAKAESLPVQKHLGAKGVHEAFPSLRADAAVGAVAYWDGRVDDARLVVDLVRTAQRYGALAAHRAPAEDLLRDDTGRVTGARVRDLLTGDHHEIRAHAVVSATGVWTEQVQDLADSENGLRVHASKGIHVTVPRDRIRGECGLILQTEKSVLFVIPWRHHWVIGTTDTDHHGDLAHPTATREDVHYVLERANTVLRDPLTEDDVLGTWAGLRPLVQPGTKGQDTPSTKISREHTVTRVEPGFWSIAGGKLTTYRVMARDAVDAVLGKRASAQQPSVTEELALLGAPGWRSLRNQAPHLAGRTGIAQHHVEHLLDRYGDETLEVLDTIRAHPDLGEPVVGAPAYLRAEIHRAVTHEGALHLEDVMCRRTRIAHEYPHGGADALPEVAGLMARALGWDERRTQDESDLYRARQRAIETARGTPDEDTAVTYRGAVGDPYPDLVPQPRHTAPEEGRQA